MARSDRTRFEVIRVKRNGSTRYAWKLFDKYGRLRTKSAGSFSRVNNTRRDAIRTRRAKALGEHVPIVNTF